MTDGELQQFIASQSQAPAAIPQDIKPNGFAEILGSAAKDSVSAIPALNPLHASEALSQPIPVNDAGENIGTVMNRAMGAPNTPFTPQVAFNPFAQMGQMAVQEPEQLKTMPQRAISEQANTLTTPMNYMIPKIIESAGIIPVGKFTIGELLKLPPNRIKDAITGKIAPEVVERFLTKLSVLKKLIKHLPENIKSQKMMPENEVTKPPSLEIPGQEAVSPQEKLMSEIKAAKPVRQQQNIVKSEELRKRFGRLEEIRSSMSGEARYHAQKSVMRGEIPKVKFDPIEGKFSQFEKDSLLDVINKSPRLTAIESFETSGIFEKMMKGQVPTEREMELLQRAFGDDIADALLSKLPLSDRVYKLATEIFSTTPRATKAAYDLSMPFNQGLMFIGDKAWWKAFKPMVKALFSEDVYQNVMKDIYSRPNYPLMRDSGLFIANSGASLTSQEETFASSLAEKYIPGIHQTGRAANTFMNKLRADVFDSMIEDYKKMGINVNEGAARAAKFINVFSGRGGGGVIARNTEILNMFMYSARFQASRWQILNPKNYLSSDPVTRKAAIKSLAGFVGVNATFLTFAKLMGAKVELDPRSSDFGEAIWGKAHIGITAGMDSVITLIARLATNQYKDPDGKIQTYGKRKAWNKSRGTAIGEFLRFKESPLMAFIHTMFDGKTAIGEKIGEDTSIPKEIWRMYEPMVESDWIELFKEGNLGVGLLGTVASIFGGRVSVYKDRKTKGNHRR